MGRFAVSPRNNSRVTAQEKVPAQAGKCREHANSDEQQRQPNAPWAWAGRRRGPLDPTRLHIEDPSEADNDGKTGCQTGNNVREHYFGPVGPVHNRLDNLEHGERRDGVADKRAEYTPALQLREPAVQASRFRQNVSGLGGKWTLQRVGPFRAWFSLDGK